MDAFVLHQHLAIAPWMDPALWRLPGVKPILLEDWLVRDEVFAAQMQLRDKLIAERPGDVHALLDQGRPAALECLDLVLGHLANDTSYTISANRLIRPDGIEVEIDRDAPLLTLGRLVQSDFCIMEEGSDGHVLNAAILCFPGSWTLAEKIGKPLFAIHTPVREYDENVGARVQRLFDAIQPGKLLMRANAIRHEDPSLYHPRRESDPVSVRRGGPDGKYIRSERQVLRRLPATGAVVFSIHTTVIPIDRLSADQQAGLETAGIKSG
jgi:hypothetical protein